MASKRFYELPRRLVLSALLCLTLGAQTSGYLTVGEPQKAAGKRGAALQVKIPVTVRAGYHVNSNKPNDEYLIPLKVTWKSTGGLEGGEITYPKPSMEKYPFSETPLSVYTGSFELAASFKIPATAPAGPGVAVGQLRYQACDDKACYPPKTVEFSLPYQVQ